MHYSMTTLSEDPGIMNSITGVRIIPMTESDIEISPTLIMDTEGKIGAISIVSVENTQ